MRRGENLSSPTRKVAATSFTPDSRTRASQLLDERVDECDGHEVNEEDDEETLQLKLAEIKARLKLKQLQRSRATRGDDGGGSNGGGQFQRPNSARSTLQSPKGRGRLQQQTEDVQVPLSPTRKAVTASAEPSSPRRFVYGIDKGLKGHEVSLKRPPSAKSTTPSSASTSLHRRPMTSDSSTPQTQSFRGDTGVNRIKSFNERMAESRSVEKSQRERTERAEKIRNSRSSAFQFDRTEMEGLKAAAAAAAESEKNHRPKSSTVERSGEFFSREDVLRSYNLNPLKTKRSQTFDSPGKPQDSNLHSVSQGTGEKDNNATVNTPDASKFEGYSSLHLSNRILPHSFLARTLANKKVLKIPDLLRVVKGPKFELPDDLEGDYGVFGIVASKSSPKEVQGARNRTNKETDPYDDGTHNTDKYMAITLTDLTWSIDLFLFDTAFPRYYKLSEGVLIAILNPTIMPPPKHKLDTNRFSLVVSSSEDKILEVGFAKDIGFCKAVRKDGKTCQSWIDARKTEFCEFHIDAQVRRTQSQRMGVNNGTPMFGPGGRSGPRTGFFGSGGGGKSGGNGKKYGGGLKSDGRQYDPESQSMYYVAPAPSRSQFAGGGIRNPRDSVFGRSAASLIDADDDNPFAPAGMNGRGMENKEERFRRHVAERQRERDIMQKLTGSRRGGEGEGGGERRIMANVGAEYLRNRLESSNGNNKGDESTSSPSLKKPQKSQTFPDVSTPITPKTTTAGPVNSSLASLSNPRKAASVRLSPMKRSHEIERPGSVSAKKTRFITANGIREAGRESLGNSTSGSTVRRGSQYNNNNNDHNDDDDDDELDIV